MYQDSRYIDDPPLHINEVMASNALTLADHDGDYVDWVELIHTGSTPLDLSQYALSDNPASPLKWRLPTMVIQPGDIIIIYLSGKDEFDSLSGEIHASFRLGTQGESILLTSIHGQILDQWTIDPMTTDQSLGRVSDGDTLHVFTHPTPGYNNTEEGYHQFIQAQSQDISNHVHISEVMLSNTDTLYEGEVTPDWIELYNPTGEAINLHDYMLSDHPGQRNKWRFPENTWIEAKGYRVIYASGQDTSANQTLHCNFSLDARGEPLVLSDPDGQILDHCFLTAMPSDISYGRSDDSATFQYMIYPTTGEVNSIGWPGFAADPVLIVPGGKYADPMVITLDTAPGTQVYYTLDGSDPSDQSTSSILYEGPFRIDTTSIVRARAYQEGMLPSRIITTTYFIGVDHTLPMVSIVADPDDLFSDHAGIYAFGDHYDKTLPFDGANFNEDWEVPAYIQMYDVDGARSLDQGIGLRIFGAYSRAELKKSFTLVARSQYGAEMIDCPIFPDRPFQQYKSVILRNGASEWYLSMIRDSLLTSLARDTTSLDVQAYSPAVVYLNGEYWGVYFFREKLNKYYVQQHHGIDPENVDIIYGNGLSSSNALAGDNGDWLALRDYVMHHDLSDPVHYQHVAQWIDIDNYIDMVTNEIYVGNTDTGNIKCYRAREEGAQWRWFYYDVDWAFHSASVSANHFVEYLNPDGHGTRNLFETWLIMGLLDNETFRQQFIQRMADHIQETYRPERVVERIDAFYDLLDVEMEADRTHWYAIWQSQPDWYKVQADRTMSYNNWATKQRERLILFANQRPDIVRLQLIEYFQLSDEDVAALFGTSAE